MIRLTYGRARNVAIGAWALSAALILPAAATAADAAKAPTFTKEVAPIFQAKCEACHRADSMAPMSLVTYQEARPWAKAIKARVAARQMPPWHIDKNIGIQDFKNDRSLTDQEIDTITRWVDAGAPMGDPKDMPPPIQWPRTTRARRSSPRPPSLLRVHPPRLQSPSSWPRQFPVVNLIPSSGPMITLRSP